MSRYYDMLTRKMLLLALLLLGKLAFAQDFYLVQGYITDENAEPIAGAIIRTQSTGVGTVSNEKGQYSLRVMEGYHRIYFKFIGYEDEMFEVTVQKNTVLNVVLKASSTEIEGVEISNKRRDPSYEILKRVIDNRDRYRDQYSTQRCEIYVKSTEEQIKTKPLKEETKPEDGEELEDKPARSDSIPSMNLFEATFIQHKAVPNKFKEEKVAAKKLGLQQSLFFTTTTMADFNFLDNLIQVRRLGENSYVSPISATAIVSYRYKLLRSYFENDGRKVYVIKVIPRKMGNALFEGQIEVWDSIYALKSVNLSVTKRSLILYDAFSIEQTYTFIDGKWVIDQQDFGWKIKDKPNEYIGRCRVQYSNYSFDSTYHKRFFNAEVGTTRDDAYDKDTTFWDSIRPVPLTTKERIYMEYQDSIHRLHTSKEYLDSLDSAYNHITFLKVAWHGFGHINREKKSHWTFAPLPSLIDPLAIGGWRVRYNFSYFKRYDSTRRSIYVSPTFNYGFRNQDVKGSLYTSYLYNPKKLSRIGVSLGNYFGMVNGFATFADILRRDNFYENKYLQVGHSTELFNGFYMSTRMESTYRQDLGDFEFAPAGDSLFPNNTPARFDSHSAMEFVIGFSYTPKQLYIQEPKQKIVLGSAFPTFSVRYRQAVPNILGSSSNFKYFETAINQKFNIGVMGTSEYSASYGIFLDTTKLRIMDYRYQRGGDPIFFMPPMYAYQLIDSTFATFSGFLETHYVHQFNGFITSKIPGIKQMGIRTMAGGGFLWVPERNYQYSELFGGVNRIFKVGRERFRLGLYYIVAQSNTQGFSSGFKVSFTPYNNTTNTWSF